MAMFELKKVGFRYTKKDPLILTNVSLSFDRGEFVAVTGRNGSGKTTLTRLMTGLERPDGGQVFFKGEDVTETDATGRSRFIGYVFQQPERQMFMPTVYEEVAFGPYQQGKRGEELKSLVEEALRDTDLMDLKEAYPRTLSRGDQQRVAIASSLSMNTEILVLDEPTSGQDGREKAKLVRLMHRLCEKGITIILVTHDMDVVAKDCSRVVVVAEHKVAFDGAPAELFSGDRNPEALGLSYPPSVLLGRKLPGAPYCKDMEAFCRQFLEKRKGGVQ